MKKSKNSKLLYSLYSLFTHLLIPFATIPFGIVFYYFSTATLSENDITLIFGDTSAFSASLITAILTAPVYYLHCLFNRSEMSHKWQLLTHSLFCLLTLSLVFCLFNRPDHTLHSWETHNGSIHPFVLFIIPQIFASHIIHWIWVHSYRKPYYLKLFGPKINNPVLVPQPMTQPNPIDKNPPMSREESARIFDEELETAATQDQSFIDELLKSRSYEFVPPPPSFEGKKVWETIVFKENVDEIACYQTNDQPKIIARNGSRLFHLIDSETGLITRKIEPNFHETWDLENKVFIELSPTSLQLCQSSPLIQQAYWHYRHNHYVHSSFDPYAHYQDETGEMRLRKTVYYRSIANKENTQIAYINKGENKAFIEIYTMPDHSHIQSINTRANGNHDCKFFDNNRKIAVGSDDGIIRIFDIETGELLHKFEGHTDSVFCLDINLGETELISGSADGIWKIWSLMNGDGFGQCIHTSKQLMTKQNKPIPIFHVQFSPDNLFFFIVTDIGRIMIHFRETLTMQTNIYDRYQGNQHSWGEPCLLSLLINSEEKCFYVGYANGKMQKWV
jgi:WD40 repeat protein